MSRDMDSAGSLYVAGQIALERDHPGLAANLLRRACALRPDVQSNWLGFGAALLDMREFDGAEECFVKALKIKPGEPTALANMSALALNRGRPQECIDWSTRSLEVLDHPAVRGNRGFAYLMLKNWEQGFAEYKFSMAGKHRVRRIYRQPEEPEWEGVRGQTVVVQTEQGLGDEIAFASMIPDLVAVSRKVIIDAHPKLAGVMRRSFPDCDVYGTRKQTRLDWPHSYDIDASMPMSSLGAYFRRSADAFPRKAWLVPCPDKRAKWREWLDSFPGPKVGLAWTGGMFLTGREARSTTLAEFSPLIRPDVTCISLEYRDDDVTVKAWNEANPTKRVIRPPVDQEDYDDTLALLAELDVVIGVTTTIIDACGAIGRQCWCLVPNVLGSSMWRYGVECDDVIFFPADTVRLFRQRQSEADFGPAIGRVTDALVAKLEASTCAS